MGTPRDNFIARECQPSPPWSDEAGEGRPIKAWQRDVLSNPEAAKLCPRSRRILLLKLEGLVDREIAPLVHLSLRGVRYYTRLIHRVLGTHSMNEVFVWYVEYLYASAARQQLSEAQLMRAFRAGVANGRLALDFLALHQCYGGTD